MSGGANGGAAGGFVSGGSGAAGQGVGGTSSGGSGGALNGGTGPGGTKGVPEGGGGSAAASGAPGLGGAAGMGTGGTSSGGRAPSGGAGGSGGTGGVGSSYPCDGDASGYEAVVRSSGGTWTAQRGGNTVYSGSSMAAAMQAAIDSLTPGRTKKERVLVEGSGSIPNDTRVDVASYTVLNVCGTIDVTDASGSGDRAPIYARGRTDIEIPNVTITGVPLYGMFFRDVSNLHLGRIELRLNAGLGIRIDNHGANRNNKVRNIRIDDVYVEGTSDQGVETYGVDGLTVGRVVARDTGYSGLLLNDTINATVESVEADNAGAGTGYAAFRIANGAGRVGNEWPADSIRVGQVVARGGGRGIFCVSDSGGLTIERVDLADTGNNSILLENCHNVRIATLEGRVSGGGQVRIAQRTDEHTPSSDIVLQNLEVTGTTVQESPCGQNIVICNITGGASVNACSGTLRPTCT